MEEKIKKIDTAFFSALCLYLSCIEYAIPKPLPFMRLGLANAPIVIASYKFSFIQILKLSLFKALLQNILSGTLFSYVFLFSFGGSFASAISVFFVCKLLEKNKFAFTHISLCLSGALASNICQIFIAKYIIFGDSVKYIAPLLLCWGCITGFMLGIFLNKFEKKSSFIKYFFAFSIQDIAPIQQNNPYSFENTKQDAKISLVKYLAALLFIAALYIPFAKSTLSALFITLILFSIDMVLKRGKVKILPSITIFVTFTILSLLSPMGKVIFSLKFVTITDLSLYMWLKKACVITSLVFASQGFFEVWRNFSIRRFSSLMMITNLFESLTSNITKKSKIDFTKKLDEILLQNYANAFAKYINVN